MEQIRRWVDLVYPPRCAVCGDFLSPGFAEVMCSECRGALRRVETPLCMRCGVPFNTGPAEDRICESCLRGPHAYEGARALYVYEDIAIESVHRLKYSGRTRLVEVFGPELAKLALEWLPAGIKPLVIPVPLHIKRLRERGFNQSLLLARHVAALPGYELDYLSLCRIRNTPSQSALDRDHRRQNVQAAFAVRRPAAINRRDVVLVDDVSTTGSTLDACSRTLLKSGATRVYGLTLARAPVRRSVAGGS
jgi:ComF family protein